MTLPFQWLAWTQTWLRIVKYGRELTPTPALALVYMGLNGPVSVCIARLTSAAQRAQRSHLYIHSPTEEARSGTLSLLSLLASCRTPVDRLHAGGHVITPTCAAGSANSGVTVRSQCYGTMHSIKAIPIRYSSASPLDHRECASRPCRVLIRLSGTAQRQASLPFCDSIGAHSTITRPPSYELMSTARFTIAMAGGRIRLAQ
jgi:hypothetical protein